MTIVYIGGYGRSGSTVLDRSITAHLGGVSLGEVVFFPRSVYRHQACSCGLSPQNCRFWNVAKQTLNSQQVTSEFATFKEDGIFGVLTPPSLLYQRVQRSIFRHHRSTIYCDSSKTCRHAMFRPIALDRLFPGELFFVWIKRPLNDTVRNSLAKGTNQQLESSLKIKPSSVRIGRGVLGYLVANFMAWLYVTLIFRRRSVVIDQQLLRSKPELVMAMIEEFLTRLSMYDGSESIDSSNKVDDEWQGNIHQIAGNRNRHITSHS